MTRKTKKDSKPEVVDNSKKKKSENLEYGAVWSDNTNLNAIQFGPGKRVTAFMDGAQPY